MKKVILILTLFAWVNTNAQTGAFSNPSNIYGSNFGQFFISMLRTQNYDMALKFTSKESVKKFGATKIAEKYKTFNFNYKLTQKSITKDGGKITIVYVTNEMATGKMKTMTLVIENDSCKIVLPSNLGEFLK
jgi:hypothetical protein